MKKALNLGWMLFLSFTVMLSSCSSNDDDGGSNSNAAEITAIENTVESGSWRITYFYDTDSDETNNFTSYTFSFGADGVLTASNTANTYTGSWSITDSSSSSSSSDDIDFNIAFSAPPNFEELSDDWEIIMHSSTKIELIDVSGGNGGTDYLTFEKN
jgi:hypothetical protein